MDRNPTTSFWVNFFIDAGIPSAAAAKYAIVFTENRIQTDMLLDLNKEYLKDMGISVLGDVIAILKHSKAYHEKIARDKVLAPSSMLIHEKAAQIVDSQLPKEVGKKTKIAEVAAKNPISSAVLPAQESGKSTSLKKVKLGEVALGKTDRGKLSVVEVEQPLETLKRKVPQSLPIKPQIKREAPVETHSVLAKTAGEKSSVFQRLGESVVTSTTGEAESKNSIFQRLGSKSMDPVVQPSQPAPVTLIRTLTATRSTKPQIDLGKPTLKADLESLPLKQTALQRLGLSAGKTEGVKRTTVIQTNAATKRVVQAPAASVSTIQQRKPIKPITVTAAVKSRLGSSSSSPKPSQKSVFSRLGSGRS